MFDHFVKLMLKGLRYKNEKSIHIPPLIPASKPLGGANSIQSFILPRSIKCVSGTTRDFLVTILSNCFGNYFELSSCVLLP